MTGLLATVMLAGCLKDKDIEDRKYGMDGIGEINLVSISNGPEASVSMFASNEDTSVVLATVRFHSGSPAKENITVRLVPDEQLVDDAGLDLLPEDRYTIDSYTVTIPKGSNEASLRMKVVPNDVADGFYGLGFRIESVETPGYSVRAYYDEVVVVVGVRNQWDGIYHATGRVDGHTSLGGPYDQELELETVGLNTVAFYQPNRDGVFGGVLVLATINPDNSVTIAPAPGGAAVYVPAGAENKYDPATRTFHLRYNWPGTPTREATNTFVYVEPRP